MEDGQGRGTGPWVIPLIIIRFPISRSSRQPTRALENLAMRNSFLAIVLTTATCVGCAAEPQPPAAATEPEAAASTPEPLPAMIVAERGGFIPEGVEYDTANGRLLTGSLSEGSIF